MLNFVKSVKLKMCTRAKLLRKLLYCISLNSNSFHVTFQLLYNYKHDLLSPEKLRELMESTFLLYFLDNSLHGQKRNFPPVPWQSQPHQQHLFPWQHFEDCGFSYSLLLPLPGGAVSQWPGGVGVFTHPLEVSLYYIPEEYCGCGCHHDFYIPF